MANFHFNVNVISRSKHTMFGRLRKGRSVVGNAAYITKQKLYDRYTEQTYDRRSDGSSVPIIGVRLPPGAPQSFKDLQTLMDELNAAEKRKDAQMARSYILSLPIELTLSQQIELVEDYIAKNFTSRGQVAVFGIHLNEANLHGREHLPPVEKITRNPHVHILVPFRAVDCYGFLPTKKESRSTNNPKYLISLRKEWAEDQNRFFERLGLDCRVSPESLIKQGDSREAAIYLGHATIAMERKGIKSVRGDEYRKKRELIQRLRGQERDQAHDLERDFGHVR